MRFARVRALGLLACLLACVSVQAGISDCTDWLVNLGRTLRGSNPNEEYMIAASVANLGFRIKNEKNRSGNLVERLREGKIPSRLTAKYEDQGFSLFRDGFGRDYLVRPASAQKVYAINRRTGELIEMDFPSLEGRVSLDDRNIRLPHLKAKNTEGELYRDLVQYIRSQAGGGEEKLSSTEFAQGLKQKISFINSMQLGGGVSAEVDGQTSNLRVAHSGEDEYLLMTDPVRNDTVTVANQWGETFILPASEWDGQLQRIWKPKKGGVFPGKRADKDARAMATKISSYAFFNQEIPAFSKRFPKSFAKLLFYPLAFYPRLGQIGYELYKSKSTPGLLRLPFEWARKDGWFALGSFALFHSSLLMIAAPMIRSESKFNEQTLAAYPKRPGLELIIDAAPENDPLRKIARGVYEQEKAKGREVRIVRVTSKNDYFAKLKELSDSHLGAIDGTLYAHGFPGVLQIGNDTVRQSDIEQQPDSRYLFAPGAVMRLPACATAMNLKGDPVGDEMLNAVGSKVMTDGTILGSNYIIGSTAGTAHANPIDIMGNQIITLGEGLAKYTTNPLSTLDWVKQASVGIKVVTHQDNPGGKLFKAIHIGPSRSP